jgi:threonine dehydrogenase-like Zn-dependent dehydrogenase
MRAVVLEGAGRAVVRDVPEPTPGRGEVLVRVRACGLCGSDLNAWRGVPGIEYPMPAGAPGHEVWGEVCAVGDAVAGVQVGDCVTGLMWNGLAEVCVARAENLVPSDNLLLGEPLACAANVVRRAGVAEGDRVAIVGFGYLAALIAQLLPSGSSWSALSRREVSRSLALELGAEAVCDFDEVPPGWWDGFRVVIEAAGVQQTLDFASWLVAYGGRLVIAGYHADGPRTVNMQTWNWKGIDVINAHEREPRVYIEALRSVRDRRFELERLLTHRWPLNDIEKAFSTLEERPSGFVKGIIVP